MKLSEYQAKAVFERHAIPKPDGIVVDNISKLPKALKILGRGPWAIKAQILAGGRGKAGGVKIVKTVHEAKVFAKGLLGKNLVTHQTGPNGEKVKELLIEKSLPKVVRELYVSIFLDRKTQAPVLLASATGGMDIESLAKTNPEAIVRVAIDPEKGLRPFEARVIATRLQLKDKSVLHAASVFTKLSAVFFSSDANLVEINPLALLEDGSFMALDGKIITDDNALYRQADQQGWKSQMSQPIAEKKALAAGISYIKLNGNVGCLVNGAGLAMGTMDIIKLHGGEPANFLDVGGGAKQEQVTDAFKIIMSDKNVKGILVNIFGGIMRCDVIANGIVAAVKQTQLKVPLVVRLEGNKAEEGKQILLSSKLAITPASGLAEAAQLIVNAVKGN